MFTKQQIAFFATASSPNSVALIARAGTGKTFSLCEWANRAKGSGLATSFSATTVKELGDKLPAKFAARTMHSLGFSALKAGGKRVGIDKSKVFSLVKDISKEVELDKTNFSLVLRLVSLAKQAGLCPDNANTFLPDTPNTWENLADFYDVSYSAEIQEIAREILCRSNELALQKGIIDFDDMLYVALLYPHRFPRFNTILADEAQDLSALQHAMLSRMLLPGGRIIAAGDDCQAIYAWRGALANSYSELIRTFSMRTFPLTASFRCARAIVAEAQRFVPDIEAAPTAPKGEVITHETLALSKIPPVVLCRNNAPLVRLALRLLVAGRTASIAGVDIGKGLIGLTKRIAKRNISAGLFVERLNRWAAREIKRKPANQSRIKDKAAALTALAAAHPDLKAIQAHLAQLYAIDGRSSAPTEIRLSTIHSAKGLEWPEVLLLDPQLIPSKYATQAWQLKQETNLAYVAITRAKHTLHYATSDCITE